MNKEKAKVISWVDFKGRLVDRDQFRAFIFNPKGERHLAESYDEYKEMVSTGLWFDSIVEAQKVRPKRKKVKKDAADSEGVCN